MQLAVLLEKIVLYRRKYFMTQLFISKNMEIS